MTTDPLMSATVPPVAPRKKGVVPPAHIQRLLAARADRETAEQEMRAAVLAALEAGGSFREVAQVAGVALSTVQRWAAE